MVRWYRQDPDPLDTVLCLQDLGQALDVEICPLFREDLEEAKQGSFLWSFMASRSFQSIKSLVILRRD
jgi:hypothetical protein